MCRSLRASSFACGVLAAVCFGCAIGAAKNDGPVAPKYDAIPIMGGLGLQIVDHETNSLYNYSRGKKDDVVRYKLVEKIDLSLAGNAEIPVDAVE